MSGSRRMKRKRTSYAIKMQKGGEVAKLLQKVGEDGPVSARPTADHKGFDLRKTEATDISNITLDTVDDSLEVTMQIPVGDGEAFAEYEESFEVRDGPAYVRQAAKALLDAVHRAVRERAMITDRDFPCATCTAACCGREFDAVRLTPEDIDRLHAAKLDVEDCVDMYDEVSWAGYGGELVQVPYSPSRVDAWDEENPEEDTSLEETACIFLRKDGCSIYEHRPKVCREFSAWTCDIYEEDETKIEGNVHLRVLP